MQIIDLQSAKRGSYETEIRGSRKLAPDYEPTIYMPVRSVQNFHRLHYAVHHTGFERTFVEDVWRYNLLYC
ncbi:hypothetical protein D3C74_441110 [compost metagenome]